MPDAPHSEAFNASCQFLSELRMFSDEGEAFAIAQRQRAQAARMATGGERTSREAVAQAEADRAWMAAKHHLQECRRICWQIEQACANAGIAVDLSAFAELRAEKHPLRVVDRCRLAAERVKSAAMLASNPLTTLQDAPAIATPETQPPVGLEPATAPAEIPALDTGNGQWVTSKTASELEGKPAATLRTYRSRGYATPDRMCGQDPFGRVWRRAGTRNSHPWYLKASLESQKNL